MGYNPIPTNAAAGGARASWTSAKRTYVLNRRVGDKDTVFYPYLALGYSPNPTNAAAGGARASWTSAKRTYVLNRRVGDKDTVFVVS